VAGQSIDDITDSYRRLISGMERLPVLVGHSFGGMIAEKLLREEQAAAVVALDAAESRGALPAPLSELRSTLPVFKDPDAARDAVSLSSEHFRTSFGTAVDADESQALWERWAIAGPVRPLLEAAAEGYSGDSPTEVAADTDARGPLLLVLGRQDHKAAGAITKAALKASRHTRAKTDVLELPDRGPSLTIDHGWREVAEACLAWLDQVGV
jgi:pimeloyl-ACP methyl ester carboxylesterase